MPYMFRKDSTPANELTDRAAQLDPSFFFPVMVKGWIKLESGNAREAIPFLKKSVAMDAPPFVTAYLAYARGASGDKEGARRAREGSCCRLTNARVARPRSNF